MYTILLLVLTIAITSTNGRTVPNDTFILQKFSRTIASNGGPPANCNCRTNGKTCSQHGCSRGDNLNCDLQRGNIYYSVQGPKLDREYFDRLEISACACPNYKDIAYETNVQYFEYDYIITYNYTTCDNIAIVDPTLKVNSEFARNAVSCCFYCCQSHDTPGGD